MSDQVSNYQINVEQLSGKGKFIIYQGSLPYICDNGRSKERKLTWRLGDGERRQRRQELLNATHCWKFLVRRALQKGIQQKGIQQILTD